MPHVGQTCPGVPWGVGGPKKMGRPGFPAGRSPPSLLQWRILNLRDPSSAISGPASSTRNHRCAFARSACNPIRLFRLRRSVSPASASHAASRGDDPLPGDTPTVKGHYTKLPFHRHFLLCDRSSGKQPAKDPGPANKPCRRASRNPASRLDRRRQRTCLPIPAKYHRRPASSQPPAYLDASSCLFL